MEPKSLEDVLVQVSKLQRLASRAATEGEAQAATLAIQRLVSRYRLSEEDLRRADLPELDHVHRKLVEGVRIPYWQECLAQVLAFHNGCVLVRVKTAPGRKGLRLWFVYGRYADTAVVEHLFAWLRVDAPRLAPKTVRVEIHQTPTTPRYREDWCVGFVDGLNEKLLREREVTQDPETSRAIVLVDQRRSEATAALMKLDPTVKTRDAPFREVIDRAFREGRARGKDHHLGKALGEGKDSS